MREPPSESERNDLDRLARGDRGAFDALFREHYPRLVTTAEALLHDRSAAEEVAQLVMVELWQRRTSLLITTSLRAYLVRAVRNRALNELRRERNRERAADTLRTLPVSMPPPDAELDEAELRAAYHSALDELPQRCREVFELSRVHGLRYAEIAHVLGISSKTVENQMGRALRVLRERLAPWIDD